MARPQTGTTRPAAATPTAAPADDTAPRGCTNFKLRRLTRRVSQHYDQLVAAAGLKTTQYSMLSHIVQLGPIRPGELALQMDMDASTLTRNLQPLVAQGWVALGEGSDARSRSVTATVAGRAKRVEAQREWKRAQLALNKKLGIDKVAQLHTLLDDCLAALNEAAGADDE